MKKIMTEWRNFLNEEEQQPLTVGQLKATVEVLASNEDQNTKKEKLKKLGASALKIGLQLTGFDLIKAGAEMADNLFGLFQAATDPKIINQGKLDNEPWVALLGIDPAFSKVIDDRVEKAFLNTYIKKHTEGIAAMNPEAPLPNFTNLLAQYINNVPLKPSPLQVSKK